MSNLKQTATIITIGFILLIVKSPYVYKVDFRPYFFEGIHELLLARIKDEVKICLSLKNMIKKGERIMRQHPAVRFFHRGPLNIGYRPNKQSWEVHTFALNSPSGRGQKNSGQDWFFNKVIFAETENEKMITTSFVDVTDRERPASIKNILPAPFKQPI